jgi:hypothetical protein
MRSRLNDRLKRLKAQILPQPRVFVFLSFDELDPRSSAKHGEFLRPGNLPECDADHSRFSGFLPEHGSFSWFLRPGKVRIEVFEEEVMAAQKENQRTADSPPMKHPLSSDAAAVDAKQNLLR